MAPKCSAISGETLLVGDLCRLGVKFNALGEFFLSGSGKIRCSIADFSGIHAETDVKATLLFEVFEENLCHGAVRWLLSRGKIQNRRLGNTLPCRPVLHNKCNGNMLPDSAM